MSLSLRIVSNTYQSFHVYIHVLIEVRALTIIDVTIRPIGVDVGTIPSSLLDGQKFPIRSSGVLMAVLPMFRVSLISPREDSGISQITTARYLPLRNQVRGYFAEILVRRRCNTCVIVRTLVYLLRRRSSARAAAVCRDTSASFFCRISAKRGDKCIEPFSSLA